MVKLAEDGGIWKKLNTLILAAGFLAYVCFNLFLMTRHQPYRDEANVWLMAKYLSPAGLLREIHYQAHPCLWYFLVMPFAKLGFPYKTIEVLSFLVMTVSAGFFLAKAKVNSAVKLFFLASPFCTYFYPVIARNYCLIALLMMLCGWVYPMRNERPCLYGLILGLLVQADSIAIAEAGALSLAWMCENAVGSIRQKRWREIMTAARGLWIPLVSLIFWILQIRGVSGNQAYGFSWQGYGAALRDTGHFCLRITERLTGWSSLYIMGFFVIFLGACILLSFAAKTAAPLFVMVVSYLFQACFSVLFHELHIWHFLSLGFVMLWMLWVLGDKIERAESVSRIGRAAQLVSGLMVICLTVCMAAHWNSDEETSNLDRALHAPYSDGYNAACFVRENIPDDAVIITMDVAMSSSILAYLDGYEFICAGSRLPAFYATWSKEELARVRFEELDEWVGETFAGIQEYYVIQTTVSSLENAKALKQYDMIYKTAEPTTKGEDYRIYRIVRGRTA